MGITLGWVITIISVLGIVGCIVGLLVSNRIFVNQRKTMLQNIEME